MIINNRDGPIFNAVSWFWSFKFGSALFFKRISTRKLFRLLQAIDKIKLHYWVFEPQNFHLPAISGELPVSDWMFGSALFFNSVSTNSLSPIFVAIYNDVQPKLSFRLTSALFLSSDVTISLWPSWVAEN